MKNPRTPSRRQFLGSTAAAAGALTLGRASAEGDIGRSDRPLPQAPEKKPIPDGQPIDRAIGQGNEGALQRAVDAWIGPNGVLTRSPHTGRPDDFQ